MARARALSETASPPPHEELWPSRFNEISQQTPFFTLALQNRDSADLRGWLLPGVLSSTQQTRFHDPSQDSKKNTFARNTPGCGAT